MNRFLSLCVASFIVCSSVSAETIGIVNGSPAYVALLDDSGVVAPVTLPSYVAVISEVDMNNSALSVIGGQIVGGLVWDALVSPSGDITPFSTNESLARQTHTVAINASGNSIIAGGSGNPIGVIADSMGNAEFLEIVRCNVGGTIQSAALNNSGFMVLVGDSAGKGIYIGRGVSGSTTVEQVYCDTSPPFASSSLITASINNQNLAIVGGYNNYNAYTALFDASAASPVLTVITLPFTPGGGPSINSSINSVAINNSGTSIIGGVDNTTGAPYAALVDASGELTPSLSGTPLPTLGIINSVDINSTIDYAILGGKDSSNPSAYAAFVTASGAVHPISGLPTGSSATINSVSINAWGVALLGGTSDGTDAYVALATPWSGLVEIPTNASHVIDSVSIRNYFPFGGALSKLLGQRRTITGNDLIFARYITNEAPQKIPYFLPSLFTGTLADALQNAAPTRNALSLFAVNNNLFFLSNSLSMYSRNRSHSTKPVDPSSSNSALMAWNFAPFAKKGKRLCPPATPPEEKKRPFTLWLEPIGAVVWQQEQNQTVGFQPSVVGGILGLERSIGSTAQVGGGVAYTFTHIHEESNSGFSNINQEYLFLYGGWSQWNFYIDAAVWGGLFQTDQVRLIHMTRFDFRSSSSPHGTQVSPHLEVGYNLARTWGSRNQFTAIVDPFAMIDWPNSWQERFTETGDGPFNATQKANHSSFLRVESGLRFYETFRFQAWVLTLEEKGSYVYRHPYHFGSVEAFLVGSPGSFTLETLNSTQSLGAVEVSCCFEPMCPAYPYGSVGYQGELGAKYQSHQLTLEIGWKF
jgi:uncharacterized protein with beta-barrel porin domain